MDLRAEKIAQARRKLREHQEKKTVQNQELQNKSIENNQHTELQNNNLPSAISEKPFNIVESVHINESNGDNIEKVSDLNVTEILISNKTHLEIQINKLTEKLTHLENLHTLEVDAHNNTKQKITALECELSNLSTRYAVAIQEISYRDTSISELNNVNVILKQENDNLTEQFEFTKSLLTSKETEIAQLHEKIGVYENQLEVVQLQIQQLTNNSSIQLIQTDVNTEEVKEIMTKNANLEQKIEALEKERNQISSHYEHYVKELNEQLTSVLQRNESLSKELQGMFNRENSLIEQISEMEIRLQNYHIKSESIPKQEIDTEIQKLYQDVQTQLMEANIKNEELQKLYNESLAKIEELNQIRAAESNQEKLSIDKLNADITSDKIAAQKATEQNRKLKSNVEELEQIVIKMGNDKLQLTELWTHEKQLNKGLVLKLAEIEETANEMSKKLKAKDGEMIRLQNENREIKRKYDVTLQQINHLDEIDNPDDNKEETKLIAHHHSSDCTHHHSSDNIHHHQHFSNDFDHHHSSDDADHHHHHSSDDTDHHHHHSSDDNHFYHHSTDNNQNSNDEVSVITSKPLSIIDDKNSFTDTNRGNTIPKEDAMNKLQQRFLHIMEQVANLSDEKHRLEHIILQLQNETDTICEYVALYQQQRSLLKKREEERSNQLKVYQIECDNLKRHLEELRGLLVRFASDNEMQALLKDEQRHNDLKRVSELLEKLENCSLINPKFKHLDMNVFYPCSCCSGQIIDI